MSQALRDKVPADGHRLDMLEAFQDGVIYSTLGNKQMHVLYAVALF